MWFQNWPQLVEITDKKGWKTTKREGVSKELLKAIGDESDIACVDSGDLVNNDAAKVVFVQFQLQLRKRIGGKSRRAVGTCIMDGEGLANGGSINVDSSNAIVG